MTARSAVLNARGLNTTAATVLVACPANTTLIVKDARVMTQGAGGGSFQLYVAGGQASAAWLIFKNLTFQQPDSWQGWVIMEPGDTVYAITASPPTFVWISGTVLEGVARSTDAFRLATPLPADVQPT